MSKKKKNGNKNQKLKTEKLIFATALLSFVLKLLEIIDKLLE